jgi:hypothetical protein
MRANPGALKLGKKFGRIGFIVGFLGPVFFYGVPATFENPFTCPQCPYLDWFPSTSLVRLEAGLRIGLVQGLAFALVGFCIGYAYGSLRSLAAKRS